MVFILYTLYFLSPYSNPRPKLSPHRKLLAISLFHKTRFKPFVLRGHMKCPHKQCLLCSTHVITHLYPHKPYISAHTHTHTHTHSEMESDTESSSLSTHLICNLITIEYEDYNNWFTLTIILHNKKTECFYKQAVKSTGISTASCFF